MYLIHKNALKVVSECCKNRYNKVENDVKSQTIRVLICKINE